MMRVILTLSILIFGRASTQSTTTTTPATTTTTPTDTTTTSPTGTTTTNTDTTTTNTGTTTTPSGPTTTTTGGNMISPIFCSYANNTLGDCECNRQLWIAHECHSGFVCLGEFVTANGVAYEGCEIECREDEVLVVDPHNGGNWECRPTNPNTRPLICPGKFNTECACTDQPTADEPEPCKIGECECDTQVWVAHDCHEAKICDPTAANGEFEMVNCTGASTNGVDTPFVNVNLVTHTWFCSADGDNCLGSFHVGCEADSYTPDSGAPNLLSPVLLLILPVLAATVCSAIMI